MEPSNFTLLIIIGSVAGILSGMLGLGGAVVIIPATVLLLGYSQQMAQGTTLMMMVLPVGAMAVYQYYQKGMVDVKAAVIMAVFFFIGGYLGAKIATAISAELLQKLFAVLLIIIAIKTFFVSTA